MVEEDKEKGCGLGLAISQVIASLLGPAENAGLSYTSSNSGTTFTFSIVQKLDEYKPKLPLIGAFSQKNRNLKTMQHIGSRMEMDSTPPTQTNDNMMKKSSILAFTREKNEKRDVNSEEIGKTLKINKVKSEIDIFKDALGFATVYTEEVASIKQQSNINLDSNSEEWSGRALSIPQEIESLLDFTNSGNLNKSLNSSIRTSNKWVKDLLRVILFQVYSKHFFREFEYF